jgi:hypothetical protein
MRGNSLLPPVGDRWQVDAIQELTSNEKNDKNSQRQLSVVAVADSSGSPATEWDKRLIPVSHLLWLMQNAIASAIHNGSRLQTTQSDIAEIVLDFAQRFCIEHERQL